MGSNASSAANARTEVHRCKYRINQALGNLERMKTRQVAAMRTAVNHPELLRARAREVVLTDRHIMHLENLRNQAERLDVARVTVDTTEAILKSIDAITKQISSSGLSWESSREALGKFTVATQELEKSSMVVGDAIEDVTGGPPSHDDVDAECNRVLDEYGLSATSQLPDVPLNKPKELRTARELKSQDDA